jgi:hypothetical protein
LFAYHRARAATCDPQASNCDSHREPELAGDELVLTPGPWSTELLTVRMGNQCTKICPYKDGCCYSTSL